MSKLKSEKGVISLFVLLAMLFLLVFVLGIFTSLLNKKQTQELKIIELKEIYSKSFDNNTYALDDELVPIYNVKELSLAGTGEYVQIKDKIYQCGRGKNYELKQNIIADIEEDLKLVNVGSNDYKLYLSTYYINKNDYEIYYYYKNYPETYWKNIVYQKFDKIDKGFVNSGTYTNNKFNIINEYPLSENMEYMMIWTDKKGELNNIKIEKQLNVPNTLNKINVFNKYFKEIDMEKGEFYIFVNVGNRI